MTRALHALKDTKTPLVIGFITMLVFVGMAYLLGFVIERDVAGITLAMSIGNLIDFILSYVAIRRKVGPLGISVRMIKMIFVSFFTGISLWVPMRLLDQLIFDTTRTVPLITLTLVVSAVGFSVYLFFCWLFDIEELQDVLDIVKKIGNWRKILASSDEVLETTPNSI